MIERRTLARPYAKAIFEIAVSEKTHEKWSALIPILAMIAEDSKMQSILSDRAFSVSEVESLFLSICEKVLEPSSRNFILVLALNRRLEILPEIAVLYEEMRHEAENTLDVEFITPIVIDEKEKAGFKKMLEKKLSCTVKMHCEVDTKLLGGFLARAGNYVIDGSILSSLSSLKTAIGD